MSDKSLQPAKSPASPKPSKPALTGGAVKMTAARATEAFPASDPRAGEDEAHKVYLVPEEVTQATAEALVAGGNYEWTERPAPPAGD